MLTNNQFLLKFLVVVFLQKYYIFSLRKSKILYFMEIYYDLGRCAISYM